VKHARPAPEGDASRPYDRMMVGVAEREGAPIEEPVTVVPRSTAITIAHVAALAAWCGVVVFARILFDRLQAAGSSFRADAGPLHGFVDSRITPRIIMPVVVAVLIIAIAPRATRRWGWYTLVVASAVAAAAWAISLAFVDGFSGLTAPLEAQTEYLADVPSISSPTTFLSTFVDRISEYSIHVQGHPPGMVLLLAGLAHVGLGGSGAAAALVIAGGSAAVPAVLVTVRELAGERTARRAAPFVVMAPIAIWIASSAHARNSGGRAWARCLGVVATRRSAPRGHA
jgi:hypothetical protein